MKRFFDFTFKPFFVLTGIGTALVAMYAFWPDWSKNDSTNPIRPGIHDHLAAWGIMVGLMGVFMIVAAYSAGWRNPILIYSAVEKTFLVYLVVTNVSRPYARGFWFGAAMDAAVVLYTIVYFGVFGFKKRPA